MKRNVGFALAAVLALAVGVALVFGTDNGPKNGSSNLVAVHGVIGSEKKAFFDDERVKAKLAEHGLNVVHTSAGSRQIATLPDLTTNDFAFPSSAPAADRIGQNVSTKGSYSVFSSPIVIATFKSVADVLAANGVVTDGPDGAKLFNVDAYLQLVNDGVRWDQLQNNTEYAASKLVLVRTSDVRKSNSAAMFLSLTSYVANGNNVVATQEQASSVLGLASKPFIEQGYSDSTSEEPFEDYLSHGKGKTPMVVIYESQFLDRQMRGDGSIADDMMLLYPNPDTLSKHTVVAFSDNGSKLGQLLETDPTLIQLAAEYGFRPNNRQTFVTTLESKNVAPPPDLVNIIEPPAYAQLEGMITAIENQY